MEVSLQTRWNIEILHFRESTFRGSTAMNKRVLPQYCHYGGFFRESTFRVVPDAYGFTVTAAIKFAMRQTLYTICMVPNIHNVNVHVMWHQH